MSRPRNKFVRWYQTAGDGHRISDIVYLPDDRLIAASGQEYELGSFVHKGGNGTVYRCRDSQGQNLAVKFLHALDAQRVERFEFECRVLADLDHPNVLPCLDVGNVETTHRTIELQFMVTDLYDSNIERIVQLYKTIEPNLAVKMVGEACQALENIHSLGIIHRDLKPNNLFVRNDTVTVGDFGLAKTVNETGEDRFYRGDLTTADETIGPIMWMSPELLAYCGDKSYPVDERSDLFQLGTIFWYMLTGENPRGMIDQDDDPTGGKCFPIIQKVLQRKPEKRHQSATELKNELAGIAV